MRRPKPKGDPILIACEGAGAVGHDVGNLPGTRMCPMCGHDMWTLDGGVMPEHQRDDVIARIARGDFNP